MPIADHRGSHSEGKPWRLCPIWQSGTASSSTQNLQFQSQKIRESSNTSNGRSSSKVSSVAKSLLPTRRRLRLDPSNSIYFPYEPGKQVRGAVRIKNHSSSHVAFKFQTNAPKSCYMRPPGGILAPGESIIVTVFKFVEPPEKNEKQSDHRSRVKFKIVSLKVKEGVDYVPELFDEQKDEVVVERILRVIFLDADRPTPAMEKLKHQLAEAEAELELRKKPQVDTGSKVVGQGLIIDEWKERREKYLARQQLNALGTKYMARSTLLHKHQDMQFGGVESLPKAYIEGSCQLHLGRNVVDIAELLELPGHEIIDKDWVLLPFWQLVTRPLCWLSTLALNYPKDHRDLQACFMEYQS